EDGGAAAHQPQKISRAKTTGPGGRHRQTPPGWSQGPKPPVTSVAETDAPASPALSPATLAPGGVALPGLISPEESDDEQGDGRAGEALAQARTDKGDDKQASKRMPSNGSAVPSGLELEIPAISEAPSDRVRFEMLHIYEDHGGALAKQTQVVSELTGSQYRTPR
ncbi:unnamed protein product, partial [Prorocentrum cordatum]